MGEMEGAGLGQFMRSTNFLKLLLLPLIILLIHGVFSYFGFYGRFVWIDIPMHFFGGVSIGIAYLLFFRMLQKMNYVGRIHPFLEMGIITSFVSITAVFWEFREFLGDYFFGWHTQPSIADTMADLFLGMLGGVMGIIITRKLLKRKVP